MNVQQGVKTVPKKIIEEPEFCDDPFEIRRNQMAYFNANNNLIVKMMESNNQILVNHNAIIDRLNFLCECFGQSAVAIEKLGKKKGKK